MRSFLLPMVCVPLFSSFCDCSHADLLDPSAFSTLASLLDPNATVVIDTGIDGDPNSLPSITIDGGSALLGVIDNQGGLASPGSVAEIAVFTFADVDLASSVTVSVTGTRALALLSHSDFDIDTEIKVNGGGVDTLCNPIGSCVAEVGGPGGYAGGLGEQDGFGPGGGGYTTSSSNSSGAGGGFGSQGEVGGLAGTPGMRGAAYGDLLSLLQGGSGGGGDHWSIGGLNAGGGGGGGALEIGAAGTVTIGLNGLLEASGGTGNYVLPLSGTRVSGGNGSGGGIRVHAAETIIDVLTDPNGVVLDSGEIRAVGGSSSAGIKQAAGGGGRVFISSANNSSPYIIGEPFSTLSQGIDVSPGEAEYGDPVEHGVITLSPRLTIVPTGHSLELGAPIFAQAASTTQPELLVIPLSLQVSPQGELTVPSGGYTNEFEIDLRSPLALITGTDPNDVLLNQGVIRGTGSVEVPVTNDSGGEINAVNDTLVFTQAVTSNAGAQINAINSTLDFQAGLTNNGDLNLINSTVNGALTVANSPIVAAGDNTLSGPVVGSGNLIKQGSGTLTLTSSGQNYSGETRVEAGTLYVHDLGPNVRLPDASIVTVQNGATLRMEIDSADAIFGLNGAGNVELISTHLVLGNLSGVGVTGGVGTFSGVMTGATGNLEKRGSGTFTFAGAGTYGGFTEVENGEFILTGAITGTSNVNVIDGSLAGAGTLTIDGGLLTTLGTTTVAANAELNLMDGELNTPNLNISGDFNMTGGRLAAETVTGDLTIAGGTLAPGDSPGLTTITGNYIQETGATLEIEFGSTEFGDFDRLEISGTAMLGGTLKIVPVDTGSGVYQPQAGDSIGFLAAQLGAGDMFETFDWPDLGPHLEWQINPGGITVFLEVKPTLPGDFDLDFDVDGNDFLLWQRDPNVGNISDWEANYGMVLPPPLTAAAKVVPEPRALALLLLATIPLVNRWR